MKTVNKLSLEGETEESDGHCRGKELGQVDEHLLHGCIDECQIGVALSIGVEIVKGALEAVGALFLAKYCKTAFQDLPAILGLIQLHPKPVIQADCTVTRSDFKFGGSFH